MNPREWTLADLERRIGLCREAAEVAPGPWWPRWGGEPGFVYASVPAAVVAEVPYEKSDAGARPVSRHIAAHDPSSLLPLYEWMRGALRPHGETANGECFTCKRADCPFVAGLASALGYPGDGGEQTGSNGERVLPPADDASRASASTGVPVAAATCGLCAHDAHEGRACREDVPEYVGTDAPSAVGGLDAARFTRQECAACDMTAKACAYDSEPCCLNCSHRPQAPEARSAEQDECAYVYPDSGVECSQTPGAHGFHAIRSHEFTPPAAPVQSGGAP